MKFVIRVYGLLIDENCRVLVSDEKIKGKYYTKFPGGGLEFGEGTIECLVREFQEETGLTITVGKHFYTTDFYQQSAFNPAHQIVSIYYFVNANDIATLKTTDSKNSFSAEQIANQADCEVFRWVPLKEITAEDVSLPIDKVVAGMLHEKYGG